MNALIDRFSNFTKGVINRLLNLLFCFLTGILLAMLFVELGNIIGRPIGLPIQGSVELTGYLGAVLVSISIFYTTLRHSNVVVDLLASKLAKRALTVLEIASTLVSLAAILLLAWAAGYAARKMSLEGERSLMLSLNLSMLRYVFMLGLLLVAAVLVVDLWKTLTKGLK